MAGETNETADVQEQKHAFMTALNERDVDVQNVRDYEQLVLAEVSNVGEVGNVVTVADEFGYRLVDIAQFKEPDGELKTLVLESTSYIGE